MSAYKKKMRQAGVCACLILGCLYLEVELQRKLDFSCRLRGLDNSRGSGRHRRVGCPEIDGVERIQEVRAELKLESLGELEVFLQADIPVVVSRSSQGTECGCTSPESGCWVRIIAWVKPEESSANPGRGRTPPVYLVGSVAVGPQAARAGIRRIRGVGTQCHGEAAVESQDGADRPTAHDGVRNLIHVLADQLICPNRQLINGISSEVLSFIVITGCPFGFRVVGVLPIRRSSRRLFIS
jgi:hypothetical protein